MNDTPAAALPGTPSQTVGPFFRVCLAADAEHGHLARDESPRITLVIRVLDGAGAPVDDALVEIWQTGGGSDAAFGRLGTEGNGSCEFDTVRPLSPPTAAGHINLCLFARGLLRHLFTRVYFADDERLADDPVLAMVPDRRRATLVAQRDGADPGRWVFDIHLQGEDETVFFDV